HSSDGGRSWTLAWAPPMHSSLVSGPNVAPGTTEIMEGVKDVQFDPLDANTVYVTAFNNAIHRSSPALDGDAAFRPVFALSGYDGINALAEFTLTVKEGHTRVYAGNGVDDHNSQALFRLDDANVPADMLVDTSVTPYVNRPVWLGLTRHDPSDPGSSSFDYCNDQCTYDQVLAVPKGQPDTLVVGAQTNIWTGDGAIRSTDAGASFQSLGLDLGTPPGQGHPDVHAVVFHPSNPDIVFVGSDGGVTRTSGSFGDGSDLCEAPDVLGYPPGSPGVVVCRRILGRVPTEVRFLNKGLQAIQFFNVSADPNAP